MTVEDFPENQLGASLKRKLPDGQRPQGGSLPREPTRGLIEAPCRAFVSELGEHFPENQLGASLKLDSDQPVAAPVSGTSPRTNSGPH